MIWSLLSTAVCSAEWKCETHTHTQSQSLRCVHSCRNRHSTSASRDAPVYPRGFLWCECVSFRVLLLKYFGINKYPVHARDKTSSWKEKDPFIALPLSLCLPIHAIFLSASVDLMFWPLKEGESERKTWAGMCFWWMSR